MKPATRVLLVLIAAVLWMGAARAVEPAYVGPLGNPEEPALRPYKWLWQGVKAFFYHPVVALDAGNRRTPLLGTADVAVGVRRGSIELGENVFRGINFAAPPPRDRYKGLGRANTVIEEDLLLRNVADWAFATYLGSVIATSHGWSHFHPDGIKVGAAIFLTQKFVECHPAYNEDETQAMERRAKEIRAARKQHSRAARTGTVAMERYCDAPLGQDVVINSRPNYTGNLVKLAR